MSRIVGIDLGTTNSLVATVDAGIPMVIANAEGKRLTPSVVHFPGAGDEPWVGWKASRVRVARPKETVYSVKRFMGRRGNDLSDEEMLVTYPVSGRGMGPVTVETGGRQWTPEEISALILRKLKSEAEAFFGEEVGRAVITVPAYFNDAQRNATKRAGELAGFTVERIINEPTAAALAYGLDKLKEKARIAVYDLGGGTFDLSVLELQQGVFQVLSTNGNTRLGGDDLDKRVIDFLVERIRAAGGPDAARDVAVMSRIREAAEDAKIRLSTESEVEVSLPFLATDFSFRERLTREQLEDLTGEIVQRTRAHCLRALADAQLKTADLDQVILVGGQTRMPLVRRVVAEIFGCAEFEETRGQVRIGTEFHQSSGPQLNAGQNPDEAVALGAAIQAEILSGGYKNLLLLDVTPLSLGLETFGGLMNVIIPRNSTIPVKAGEVFTTAVDQQQSMLIHVLQGERERARDNWTLGEFVLDFERATKGVPRVGVQFEIDANGILHVLARDLRTGGERVVEIKSAVDVDDAEVQKMVEASVEHAFEDLKARQWIEARMKAVQLLEATNNGLEQVGSEMGSEERLKVQNALDQLRKALQSEDPGTGIGDLAALKNASTALDETTVALAELMMEKAMEAALRKKGLIT